MYMCVKFPPGDLNPGPCPPHSRMTTTPMVRDGEFSILY